MLLPAIRDALSRRGRPEMAEALYAERHGGLRHPADPLVLADWRGRLVRRPHCPDASVFFHDCGLRGALATQFKLDFTWITRVDPADLTLAVLEHLAEQKLVT